MLALPPPVVTAPASYEISFGRVAGLLPAGADTVSVSVAGRVLAVRRVRGRSFDFRVRLPQREVSVRVVARGADRGASSAEIPHVLALAPAARPHAVRERPSAALRGRLAAIARAFAGVSAFYVRDLGTGAAAAVNPRLRFPAASTLKLAIAIETMRTLAGKPERGSRVSRLLTAMLTESDNQAANDLEVLLAGSTRGGGARVDALLHALGLADSRMYGGYQRYPAAVPYVPVAGKYTTVRDLANLFALLHLAADGRGALATRFHGELTPSEARYLLYLLGHAVDRRKLGRFLPQGARLFHKAGWVRVARHDAALVYWRGGAFVAVVMTYSGAGAGEASDVLAARIGRAAFDALATPRRRRASGP
jgi:beta-lactamase class A